MPPQIVSVPPMNRTAAHKSSPASFDIFIDPVTPAMTETPDADAHAPLHSADDGQDTRAVQHYLGHKNIQHTVRYTELSPKRFKSFWED